MQARIDQASARSGVRLFSIPAGTPFLDTLCASIRAGAFSDGEPVPQAALPRITVYLPNRAARDTLGLCFLRQAEGGVTFLPRIRVLGHADAETAPRANVPAEMERRLLLAQLVLSASEKLAVDGEPLYARFTPAEAFATAGALADLFDEIETEGRDIADLSRFGSALAPEQEQLSRRILVAVAKGWGRIARERGWIGPARYRNQLLEREAADLAAEAYGPVIVAGSTGSIAATAGFMRAVLALPQGAIVLPGLDRILDEPAWKTVADHPEHPQHGLANLLAKLGKSRAEVRDLRPTAAQAARTGFLGEALRPASTLASWPGYIAKAQDGGVPAVSLPVIEAEHPQDEAGIIAHLLREALETPGRTAALVTPDAGLRNRVSALLARWGISPPARPDRTAAVSYTHLRAHET
jgi:ATP-dependent helicase/nuclease subunit B